MLLRKGEGFTRPKLAECETILGLALVDEQLARTGIGNRVLAAEDALKQVILSVADSRAAGPRLAILGAFGFWQRNPADLTVRREDVASEVGKSFGTIRGWEDEGIQEIVFRLIELSAQASHRERLERAPGQGPYPWDVIDTLEVETFYRFEQGRVPAEWHQTRLIRPRVDGVRGVTVRYIYTGDPDATEPKVHEGGFLERVLPLTLSGVHLMNVGFGEPLRAKQAHRLRYGGQFTPGGTEPKPFLSHAVEEPTRAVILRIQFARDAIPAQVRPFQGAAYAFPPDENELEDLADILVPVGGSVEKRFESPDLGWGYGLRWNW